MGPARLGRLSTSFTPYPTLLQSMSRTYYATSSSPAREEPAIFSLNAASSPYVPRTIDDESFLSSDLDMSFASISVTSNPGTPTFEEFDLDDLTSVPRRQDAMDISPMPPKIMNARNPPSARSRSNSEAPLRTTLKRGIQPTNSDERAFGREVSNTGGLSSPPAAPVFIRTTKASPGIPPVPSFFDHASNTSKPAAGRHRTGLPSLWLQPSPVAQKGPPIAKPTHPIYDDVSSPEKMDLDSSQRREKSDKPFITSSPPPEAAKELADDSLFDDSLFFESNSPQTGGIVNKKRRSEEIEDVVFPDEQAADGARKSSGSHIRDASLPNNLSRKSPRSSSPGSSPSNNRAAPVGKRLFERFATTGASSGTSLFGKRTRPSINSIQASDSRVSSSASVRSAYPGLYGPGSKRVPSTLTAQPAPRRSISAQVKPDHIAMLPDPTDGEETEEEEVSFDTHSPIAHYKRHGMAQRSASYTQGPMTAIGAPSMLQKMLMESSRRYSDEEDEVVADRSMSKHLPGCRDSETQNKILPCFAVKEDGIVRITPHTLEDLLAGVYDDHMEEFHVIDCRFDYEFEGGHVEGAVNLDSADSVVKWFFEDVDPPAPSQSGPIKSGEKGKTVIVLHCEFSAKRGPSFATNLRREDRKRCVEAYPKVHYPEVYVLHGGYKGYFDTFPERCKGYTPMDDPRHIEARREKIDNLRKWERTKSYTFGERTVGASAQSSSSTSSKTVASGPPRPAIRSSSTGGVLSAASATVGRRGGTAAALGTLLEQHHEDASFATDADSSFGGPGDSPCPPVLGKTKHAFATVRSSRPRPIQRAETMGSIMFG